MCCSSPTSPLIKKMIQRGWRDLAPAGASRKPGLTAAQQQATLDAINRATQHLGQRVSTYLASMDMDQLTYKLPAWALPPAPEVPPPAEDGTRTKKTKKKGGRSSTHSMGRGRAN